MITIRKATIKDLETLQSFYKKLSLFESQFTDEFNEDWAYGKKGKRFFEKLLTGRNAFALVTEDNGEMVGYASVSIKKTTFRKRSKLAVLEQLFVNDDYRGKGVGTLLMQEVKRKLKAREVPRLQLYAVKSNEKAIDFYKKNGFIEFLSVLETDL